MRVFYQLQFAETMGSGLHRIKTEMAKRDLPAPSFESSSRPERFIATFRFQSFDEGSETMSGGSETKSGGSEAKSGGSEAKSGGSPASLLQELPDDLRIRIDQLGGRASRTDVEALIEELCTLRPFRPLELAEVLGRGRDYVTQSYLSPMVEDERLERVYPDTPGHPKQAYRIVGDSDD